MLLRNPVQHRARPVQNTRPLARPKQRQASMRRLVLRPQEVRRVGVSSSRLAHASAELHQPFNVIEGPGGVRGVGHQNVKPEQHGEGGVGGGDRCPMARDCTTPAPPPLRRRCTTFATPPLRCSTSSAVQSPLQLG